MASPCPFPTGAENLPFIHELRTALPTPGTATDNGKIFRTEVPATALNGVDPLWYCKYANLQRTASREDDPAAGNEYLTGSFFVPQETFIFPNPLRRFMSKS